MRRRKGRGPAPLGRVASPQAKFLKTSLRYHSPTPPTTKSLPLARALGIARNLQVGGGA